MTNVNVGGACGPDNIKREQQVLITEAGTALMSTFVLAAEFLRKNGVGRACIDRAAQSS